MRKPMKNCYNAGSITGKRGRTGGIVGNTGSTSLFKCVNNDDNFATGTYNQNLCKVNDYTDGVFNALEYDTAIWKFNGDGKPTLKWETIREE